MNPLQYGIASGGQIVAADEGILVNLTAQAVTTETAKLSVEANAIDGDVFYVVYQNGGAEPDADQIAAGTDGDDVAAAYSKRIPLASVDVMTYGPMNLQQDTDWQVRAVHRTPDLVFSEIESASFSTPDTAPVLTGIAAYAFGATSAIVSFVTDDINGTAGVVFSASTTKPTVTQVLAGQNHLGASVPASSRSITSRGRKAFLVTGLTAGSVVYAHAAHKDAANQEGVVVTSAAITLDATETSAFSAAADGTISAFSSSTAGITASTSVADAFGGTTAVQLTDPASGNVFQLAKSSLTLSTGVNRLRALVKVGAWAGGTPHVRFPTSSMTPAFTGHVNLTTKAWATGSYTNRYVAQIDDEWLLIYGELMPASDAVGTLNVNFTDNASNNSIVAGCAQNHTITINRVKVTY